MYDTEFYDRYDTDYVEFRVGPCISNTSKDCASKSKIEKALDEHQLRLTMSKFDGMGNLYWEELAMPDVGKSITLYIRETTVIQDTFSDFLSRLFSSKDVDGDNTY